MSARKLLAFVTSPVLLANFNPMTWIAMISLVDYGTMMIGGAKLPYYRHILSLVASVYLVCLLCYGVAIDLLGVRNFYLPKYLGRFRSEVPDVNGNFPKKQSGNGLVCFILGSQSNHPFGVFAPNVVRVGAYFEKMWKELDNNPGEWGFLGRTDQLITQHSDQGNKLFHITYWRSIEDLHRFNLSRFHMDARRWWGANYKQMPHLGIFHETYGVAPHKWETIYENFHPTGLGQAKRMSAAEEYVLNDCLIPTPGTNMFTRMGQAQAEKAAL